MTKAQITQWLERLAFSAEQRLNDEAADRQLILEDLIDEIRQLVTIADREETA